MFRKDKSLSLKTSVSALGNNLSVYVDVAKSTVHYAVVHKFFVNLISSSLDGQTINHRQIIGKEPTASYGTVILQVCVIFHILLAKAYFTFFVQVMEFLITYLCLINFADI